ncbi:MAG TPA: cation-transporting P-type ATPase, partial [Ramlibacter sp.]|nr:cation-transporting P-type ATPase [Ramlibacter sp.]
MSIASSRSKNPSRPVPDSGLVPDVYWSLAVEAVMARLDSAAGGLSAREAGRRLKQYGPNALRATRHATALGLFANQFKSPLVLILIVAS